jgi:superfamily I DNA/RNA helicase
MTSLRQQDLRDALVDEAALMSADTDLLAGPFAHIVVDEAQELTDAQWQMLLARCPSGSFTVVGDRAQARHGFTESWQERLERIGLDRINLATLSINYRTPTEVMAEAEPVIRAVLPDANVPTSVRSTGVPVLRGSVSELGEILDSWLAEHAEGIACVIGAGDLAALPSQSPRLRSLTPELAKGLEFDLVVLIDAETSEAETSEAETSEAETSEAETLDGAAGGIEAAVDRYVSMTRATQRLVLLTSP